MTIFFAVDGKSCEAAANSPSLQTCVIGGHPVSLCVLSPRQGPLKLAACLELPATLQIAFTTDILSQLNLPVMPCEGFYFLISK